MRSAPFPQAVAEIPVASIRRAAAYYVRVLGFRLDWGDEAGGIAGISRGDCRLFLTNAAFRGHYGTRGPATIWLNLDNKEEVDELYAEWRPAGATVLAEPADQPWYVREFRVGDPDGNQIRVFYDFRHDLQWLAI